MLSILIRFIQSIIPPLVGFGAGFITSWIYRWQLGHRAFRSIQNFPRPSETDPQKASHWLQETTERASNPNGLTRREVAYIGIAAALAGGITAFALGFLR